MNTRILMFALAVTLAACAARSEGDAPTTDTPPVETPAERPFATLPAERGGQDVVGSAFPELELDRWFGEAPKNQLTLYRWWTDGCPYCGGSLPAVERLRQEYGTEGLATVAIYHPKSDAPLAGQGIPEGASALGFHGTVALDEDWSELKRSYLDRSKRRATSVSLLVDREGTVRFVHPGPILFPSDDPRHAQENADYVLLDRAIRALLGLPGRS